MNNYFEIKTRDNGEKFYTVSEGEHHDSLTDLVRELHCGIFPTDAVYEIVSSCFDCLCEDASYDDSHSTESPYSIYTHEINVEFCKLSSVIEMLWDEISELVYFKDGQPSPNEYMQCVVYAYYDHVMYRCREWLNDSGYWNAHQEEINTIIEG